MAIAIGVAVSIAKTISIGPKMATAAAAAQHVVKVHLRVLRNLVFLVPGSSSKQVTPRANPSAVTTGAESQQIAFTATGAEPLRTGIATASQPV